MARPRASTYDDQLALILSRAAALFAGKGYSAATMNDVAAACALSKATLYHYVSDKRALLAAIAIVHVQRLERVVAAVKARQLAPAAELQALIEAFMTVYAGAQHEHRVLTEDVKFLGDDARRAVEDGQRRVVGAFKQAIAAAHPGLDPSLRTPLAMLLFGMINWTFTWMKPGGTLSHDTLAPIVAELFFGGLPAVSPPAAAARRRRARAAAALSA
jgi:TetR/AcrR family transcriptional regulator